MKKNEGGIREFLHAVAETDEALIDTMLDNEILKAIPVVNLLSGVVKGARNIREIAFAVKLKRFLIEPNLVRTLESEKVRQRLAGDDEYAEEVGERLFLIIEKMTDMQKPQFLARAFSAYLNEEIDRSAFYMVAHALDISFIGDLEYFIHVEGQPVDDPTLAVHRLSNAGLFELYTTGTLNGGDVRYQTTPLGATLYEVIRPRA
jgi:hypothetical protein